MKRLKIFNSQVGATLVEVLVAIGLLGIMIPALTTALVTSYNSRPTATQKLSAISIMHQDSEALRVVREADWNNISTNGTYHPVISGNTWTLASGSSTANDFTDQIVISDVQRDSSGNIVTSGGTVDPSTKLATITVSWTRPNNASVSNDIYLTRWQNETSWSQTSVSDFSADTLVNTSVTNTAGGEVQLTPGQSSGTLTSTSFDATKSVGFNYLSFNTSIPSGTDLKFQIASNNDNLTWNYVGPDGTSSSFFTSPGQIPYSQINGRYFRYQVSFSTTNSSSAVLNDITLTYSQ